MTDGRQPKTGSSKCIGSENKSGRIHHADTMSNDSFLWKNPLIDRSDGALRSSVHHRNPLDQVKRKKNDK